MPKVARSVHSKNIFHSCQNIQDHLCTVMSNFCKFVGSITKGCLGVYILQYIYLLEKVLSSGQQYTHSVRKTHDTFQFKMYMIIGSFCPFVSFTRGKTASWKWQKNSFPWIMAVQLEGRKWKNISSHFNSQQWLLFSFCIWDQSIVKDNVDAERKCEENCEKWMSWTTGSIKFSKKWEEMSAIATF